jgi:hypothetical protein
MRSAGSDHGHGIRGQQEPGDLKKDRSFALPGHGFALPWYDLKPPAV